jgi:hypothetical protein
MRIHELLDGHPLRETDMDDPDTGTSIPLATIVAPGAAPVVDPEVVLARSKPLRRLKRLDRGGLTASSSDAGYGFPQ